MAGYVICPLTVVPVRMAPSHRGEMGSQLLYGEMAEVLEHKGPQWTKIRCVADDYIGWSPTRQLRELSPAEAHDYRRHFAFSLDVFSSLMGSDDAIAVTLGAHLPGFDGMRFAMGDQYFTFSGQAVFPEDMKPGGPMAIKMARKLLNAPFLWGGRTIFGIDSPGLVQLAFAISGFQLPRTAELQVNRGEIVNFMEEAYPGDVAFFENNQGRITHSGILLPDSKIIHVYEKVRIDAIDHFGIFNYEEGNYTHRLRVVKRFFAPDKAIAPVVKTNAIPEVVRDTQQVLF